MSKQRNASGIVAVLEAIGAPLVWGLAATAVFYVLVHQGVIQHPLVSRYFAGHPVEYVETAMFFVGLTAIVRRSLRLLADLATLEQIQLPPVPAEGQRPGECGELLESLARLPARLRHSCLGRRLREALEQVHRKGSADELDADLKYLADLDAARSPEGYALARIIIWAIPMLGFLGTVIGITLALGDLSPESLVNSPKEAMEGLLGGLSIAFDTTALALTLSIVLMFAQFLGTQVETELLAAVDVRANRQLVGRFQQLGAHHDPHLASVRGMIRELVDSMDRLVQRQTELWHGTVEAARERWGQMASAAGRQLEQGLAGALDQTLETHQARLVQAEEATVVRAERQLTLLQQALERNAAALQAQQQELARQGEIVLQLARTADGLLRHEPTVPQVTVRRSARQGRAA